ncbi:MAG TPA: DUF4132 domain-containing protein [Gemmataceae bacterium]|nr:DUF4132 domain-containing protein [Gemmataceae bacterium]
MAKTTDPAALIDRAIQQFLPRIETGNYYGQKIEKVPAGKTILAQDREVQAAIVRAALDRLPVLEEKIAAHRSKLKGSEKYNPNARPGWDEIWQPRFVLLEMLRGLLRKALPLTEADLIRLFEWPLQSSNGLYTAWYPWAGMASAAECFAADTSITGKFADLLNRVEKGLRKERDDKDARNFADRFQTLLAGAPQIKIESGEAWSDAALSDLKKLKAKPARAWNALLTHCQTGGKGKLTPAWEKDAQPLIDAVGFDSLKDHALRWFPLVDKPRTEPRERDHPWEPDYDQLIVPQHVELLRGLVWSCGLKEDADLARAIGKLALSAYRKVPGKGPRLVSLGNACVTALGHMPGRAPIGQLAVLKVKVKFGTAQKEIEKAFNAAAARENLPRDEIEELAVPAYGLEEVGVLRETLGDYRAELVVDGGSTAIHWFKDGKPLKSAPAAAKKDHAAEVKELQSALKDINTMLPVQRERLDASFLAQKTWPLGVWRERYLDHPLIGTIARRLIWSFASKGKTADGIWHGGRIVSADGRELAIADDATATLWHPIGRPVDAVLAWRDWLDKHEVVQPFKQAHREVYVLTDAERRTGTYSNRFAAHVLRQHQFHALCAARGWTNRLRLMVDADYPPAHRLLPQWNLRAEYWVEGAGSEYGQDTTDSGAYLYLATDQVRFYQIEAPQLHAHASGGGYGRYNQAVDEPLPLTDIPPLVFSEIMRDVDLFVGVASVGNDPNWADGGPGGQYRDYWQSYSFGDLSATAQTRRALLEKLIPRLKVADRCSLADKFLIVRGDVRTYKIHLGSGNILMAPNDQYLCIVAKQTVAGVDRVFLPFEGDATLSVILSKAFLLAADTRITDQTITSQLKK